MSVTVEARIANVTLHQLHDEIGKLCFAGFGESAVDFSTPSPGFSAAVTIKIFKPSPGNLVEKPVTPAKKAAAKKTVS